MKKLLVVSGIAFLFMSGEIVGGYLSGSLAIMTDAAHQLSDVAGFMMSFFAIYMSSRPSNYQMSYGYHRSEVLGALASILLIWGIIVFLLIEAVHRIIEPEEINGKIMLITSVAGLVCNFISIFTLTYTQPNKVESPKIKPSKNNKSRVVEQLDSINSNQDEKKSLISEEVSLDLD